MRRKPGAVLPCVRACPAPQLDKWMEGRGTTPVDMRAAPPPTTRSMGRRSKKNITNSRTHTHPQFDPTPTPSLSSLATAYRPPNPTSKITCSSCPTAPHVVRPHPNLPPSLSAEKISRENPKTLLLPPPSPTCLQFQVPTLHLPI